VDGVPTGGGGGGEEVVVVVVVWWRRWRSHGRWRPPSVAAPPPPPDPASKLARGARHGQASHPVGLPRWDLRRAPITGGEICGGLIFPTSSWWRATAGVGSWWRSRPARVGGSGGEPR
jgi:hypothetical protein